MIQTENIKDITKSNIGSPITNLNLGIFSGSLYFQEFRLLVLSPDQGIIDILSMGDFNPTKKDLDRNTNIYKVQGAYHYVLSNQTCHNLHVNNGKLLF